MASALTVDLANEDARPYFLWDEELTVRDVRAALHDGPPEERLRLLAKILREARDDEVWQFTTPHEVAQQWTALAPRLGRRRAFWEFLLDAWRTRQLLD
jgi:hypothetical protein